MSQVTIKSLEARIEELEAGPRSIKEDFYLAVMRELLVRLENEPDEWDALFKEEKDFQPRALTQLPGATEDND